MRLADSDPRKRLTAEAINAALVRVADLWPEGLEAVPGSHEVAIKRDADTLRTLAEFWTAVRVMFEDNE
jgi:hypothetical protein